MTGTTKFNSKRFFVLSSSTILFGFVLLLSATMMLGTSKLVVYPTVFIYLSIVFFYFFYVYGRHLKKKFSQLGQIAGKSEKEIFSAIGKPDETKFFDDGVAVHCWTSTTFRIELHTKNGVCEDGEVSI